MVQEQKNSGKPKHKVSALHSMRTKMMLLMQIGALCSCIMVLWMTVPRAEEELTTLAQNSLLSLAKAYAAGMETEMGEMMKHGSKMIYENYAEILGNAGMEGVDSSYAYMVASDGTILYHPTESKVGEPVENAVVKDVV